LKIALAILAAALAAPVGSAIDATDRGAGITFLALRALRACRTGCAGLPLRGQD